MDERSHEENIILDKETPRKFWSRIWEKDVRHNEVKHNESADWIQKVAEEMQGNKQQNIEITPTNIKKIRKMANCQSPGSDGVHGY